MKDYPNSLLEMGNRFAGDEGCRTYIEKALEQTEVLGFRLRTDGWLGYNGLEGKGYLHEIIRASAIVGDDLFPYLPSGSEPP